MRWSVVGLILVGLVAAICAAVLAAAVRAGGFQALTKQDEGVTEIEVTVAVQKLPAMTVVDAGSVGIKTVPREDAPESCYSNPLQVIGKVISVPMVKDQVFTRNCFASEGSGIQLASILENGMRAVSVSLTDYSGLYGLLYPGGLVDVLATFKQRADRGGGSDAISITLLRGIQVLGIENQTIVSAEEEAKGKGPQGARERSRRWMVTFMVTSLEAQALQLAMEHGTISLAMRNPLDMTTTVQAGPTSLKELLKNPGRALPGNVRSLARFLAKVVPSAPTDENQQGEPAKTALSAGGAVEPQRAAGTGERTYEETSARKKAPQQWEIEIYRGGILNKVVFDLPATQAPD